MKSIKKVSDIVKNILMSVPETRSNDRLLYYRVCLEVNPKVLGMPFGRVFLNLEEFNLPNLETVTRSRRKLQASYPELCANEEVECHRAMQEQKFKNYSKAVSV